MSTLDNRSKVIFSVDYDGCGDMLRSQDSGDDALIRGRNLGRRESAMKPQLLQHFADLTKQATAVELLVGSNRQDKLLDFNLAKRNNNGRCYPNYEKLALQKKWTLHKYLLADTHCQLNAGVAWDDNDKWYCHHFNDDKVRLIQAQLIYIRNLYPDEPILFNFIDDRDDLLQSLKNFFTAHPSEIPPNVTLQLTRCDWFHKAFEKDYANLKHRKAEQVTHLQTNQLGPIALHGLSAAHKEDIIDSAISTNTQIRNAVQDAQAKGLLSKANDNHALSAAAHEFGKYAKDFVLQPTRLRLKRLLDSGCRLFMAVSEYMGTKWQLYCNKIKNAFQSFIQAVKKAYSNSPVPLAVDNLNTLLGIKRDTRENELGNIKIDFS